MPLKNLLENLLLHPTLAGYFHSNLKSTECDLLKDFTDGAQFQCHPIATREKNLIVMLLYCDDTELANQIDMKSGSKGKLTVFYVTFINIPPFQRSKVRNIFLLAVGKSRDLKTPQAKQMLLKYFISTVNDLQKGCKLRSLGGEETFYGFLLGYSGDSLACHNIGFKKSFRKNVIMSCRTCTVPMLDFHKFHYEIECPFRTRSQYAEQLLQLGKATSSCNSWSCQHSMALIRLLFLHNLITFQCLQIFFMIKCIFCWRASFRSRSHFFKSSLW